VLEKTTTLEDKESVVGCYLQLIYAQSLVCELINFESFLGFCLGPDSSTLLIRTSVAVCELSIEALLDDKDLDDKCDAILAPYIRYLDSACSYRRPPCQESIQEIFQLIEKLFEHSSSTQETAATMNLLGIILNKLEIFKESLVVIKRRLLEVLFRSKETAENKHQQPKQDSRLKKNSKTKRSPLDKKFDALDYDRFNDIDTTFEESDGEIRLPYTPLQYKFDETMSDTTTLISEDEPEVEGMPF